MNDVFYVGAYWSNRKQSIDEILRPSLNVLEGFAALDSQFQYYYEAGMSREEALAKKVTLTQGELRRLFLVGVKKNDLDFEGHRKIGYSLRFWNGQSDRESSSVSFNLGSNSPRISNNCLVKIPAEGAAKERLLGFSKSRQVIDLIIENFEPEILVLTSRKLQTDLDVINEIGWVTYKKQIISKKIMSTNIIHEPNYKNGHLFYLNTDTGLVYNYDMIGDLESLKGI
ncbi:Imm52 family immunity protein [Pedobacter faecalis]|uniref:Imm52 family immunity protein n=1 Tax=Pedobacter faecalis TaxID=3041495 RepID=UPI00255135DB|nr:Imm52 family immunity protein [Pedobacter sp. ELA7]